MLPVLDLALIGFGRWGASLLRVLTQMPRVRVRAVCDSDSSRLAECQSQHGLRDALLSRDANAVMALPGLRAVVIAAPPESHVPLGLAALSAGLDVFVEKPLGSSAAEARLLVEIAEQRAAILMVGHILEYHPYLQAIRVVTRTGLLGPIHRFESERHGCIPDDAWWALAPHDLGLARSFLGAARELTAETLTDGVTAVAIRMRAGTALIRVSRNGEARIRRISLIGRDATLVFDDAGSPKLNLKPGSLGNPERSSIAFLDALAAEAAFGAEPLRVELESFVDAILSRRSPPTDGRYGLEVVELLEAADRSRAAGGVSVQCRPAPPRPSRGSRVVTGSLEPATTDG